MAYVVFGIFVWSIVPPSEAGANIVFHLFDISKDLVTWRPHCHNCSSLPPIRCQTMADTPSCPSLKAASRWTSCGTVTCSSSPGASQVSVCVSNDNLILHNHVFTKVTQFAGWFAGWQLTGLVKRNVNNPSLSQTHRPVNAVISRPRTNTSVKTSSVVLLSAVGRSPLTTGTFRLSGAFPWCATVTRGRWCLPRLI